MKEQVSLERLAELQKHIEQHSRDPDLLAARPVDLPNHISALARISLGIDPDTSIDNIKQPARTEALIIMTGIRDNLYPRL